jgi:hypothetical protein
MDDARYQGWSNHATWQANLHLSNDHGVYCLITEQAEQAWRDSADWQDSYFDSRVKFYRYNLADMIKATVEEWFDEESDSSFTSLLMSDIFSSWLSDVDWSEIAEGWVDDPADEFGTDDEDELVTPTT